MLTMKSFDIEERVNQAVHNFESGYNCAQSVFLAYSDVFELDLELAKKMSVLEEVSDACVRFVVP